MILTQHNAEMADLIGGALAQGSAAEAIVWMHPGSDESVDVDRPTTMEFTPMHRPGDPNPVSGMRIVIAETGETATASFGLFTRDSLLDYFPKWYDGVEDGWPLMCEFLTFISMRAIKDLE